MFKETFLKFSDSYLIAFGFFLFMATFLGALVWTLFIQKKSFYDELGHLPLRKGDNNGK